MTSDGRIADTLRDNLKLQTIVLVNRAYDADRISELTHDQSVASNISPKSNWRWEFCFSKRLYRERNLIKRFSSRLKPFHRIATRYGEHVASFLGIVQFASMTLWLREDESTA